MKAVIMDMRDMSLSKEVYDKKPTRFFAFFIYGLLILIITALTWAYFGHLDIVVRAQGIIRPQGQTVEVFNIAHGEVREVLFYEGMHVARGDILFALDTFQLENEKGVLQEQLDTVNLEYESLRLFLKSIDAGENLIGGFNYEFSTRIDSLLVNLTAIDHSTAMQSGFLQEEARGLGQSLGYTQFELQVLRAFEQSVTSNQDMFGVAPAQGRRREIFNAHRNQFQRYV
ncbi:MAG: biotin/lipoyl-binding protein, partial [Defluviitaleaceae bacterium]|nr:biotin/lipoyl-binding protein [Defluviitaleaceae bacterium]